jgi:hypothetical protein
MSVESLNMGKVSFRSNSKPIKKIKKVERVSPTSTDSNVDTRNLNIDELMNRILNKIDTISTSPSNNIYDENKIQPVDIDIKREISIGKVDKIAIKSEEIKGKVVTKLDKLKELRKSRNK